jgi:hypothetical protein
MNCERYWTITVRANLALFACGVLICLWVAVSPAALAQHSVAAPGTPGEVLPILPPKQAPITEPDWRKVPQPKPFIVRPPKGAPNVVIVLLDQTAYADPSTFGGPISFPTLDRAASSIILGSCSTSFSIPIPLSRRKPL